MPSTSFVLADVASKRTVLSATSTTVASAPDAKSEVFLEANTFASGAVIMTDVVVLQGTLIPSSYSTTSMPTLYSKVMKLEFPMLYTNLSSSGAPYVSIKKPVVVKLAVIQQRRRRSRHLLAIDKKESKLLSLFSMQGEGKKRQLLQSSTQQEVIKVLLFCCMQLLILSL